MNLPENIKNIIFDLGGVLLNIDYKITSRAFQDLGLKEFDEIYSQKTQQKLFDDFEKGFISAEEFRTAIKQILPISDFQIDEAWNAMLLDLPKERLQLLEELKKKYRLFLLSNTNSIHINSYSSYLQKTYKFSNLGHLFEKEYYSYCVGKRKPDQEIFQLVLEENNLKPEETLFIDDSIQHIEGAKKLRIHTIHLTRLNTILDIRF